MQEKNSRPWEDGKYKLSKERQCQITRQDKTAIIYNKTTSVGTDHGCAPSVVGLVPLETTSPSRVSLFSNPRRWPIDIMVHDAQLQTLLRHVLLDFHSVFLELRHCHLCDNFLHNSKKTTPQFARWSVSRNHLRHLGRVF